MSANLELFATFARELAELAARIAQAELDISDAQASAFGLRLSQQVCQEYAGQQVYIPSNTLAQIDQRDRDMLAMYVATGRDINAVVKHFGVCTQTAYKRIRLAEAAAYALRQVALFPSPDPSP